MKSYLPFVAHFFSPARRLAPRPLRSGRLRISAKVNLRGWSLVGLLYLSSVIYCASPSSAGKSFIDQLLFIKFH
jgi:hypothetical protein